MGYVKTDRLTLKPLQDRDKSRSVALIGEFDVAKNQVRTIERIKKNLIWRKRPFLPALVKP